MTRAMVIVFALIPALAHADPTADELRANGEQLAKDGRFTEAIAAFKASNKLSLRATNYCLIGLVYTRRELWSQAEIMIDLCKKNASANDPLPDWLPELEKTLADRLATVEVAPIEIVVEPSGVDVKLSVSSFAPDEQFSPRTIHLPPGRHVVIATAPNFNDAQHTIEVTDRTPARVVITMLPHGAEIVAPAAPRAAASEAPSHVPYLVMGAGAAVLVAGVIYHATAFRTAANHLADATDSTPDPALYDAWSHTFDVRRTTTIALYVTGALTVGVGVLLQHTVFKREDSGVAISAMPVDHGGMVSVGWSR